MHFWLSFYRPHTHTHTRIEFNERTDCFHLHFDSVSISICMWNGWKCNSHGRKGFKMRLRLILVQVSWMFDTAYCTNLCNYCVTCAGYSDCGIIAYLCLKLLQFQACCCWQVHQIILSLSLSRCICILSFDVCCTFVPAFCFCEMGHPFRPQNGTEPRLMDHTMGFIKCQNDKCLSGNLHF